MLAVGEPNRVQRLGGELASLTDLRAGIQQPVRDVVEHGLVLGEEELLEHEFDAPRTQRRELGIVQAGDLDATDPGGAAGGQLQGADDVQQRRLARSGRADDRDQLTGIDG